ncbi:MAG: F-box/WD40 repeat-containing protein [Kistimonas sp.]|nr:F-box/WD40 repeat-containing protein [Kistimonas sp.]
MMKRLSGSEPAHQPPSATQPAAGEPGNKQQPGAPPGRLSSGQAVATACVSDRPARLIGTRTILPEGQATTATPNLAQNLPDLVLQKIFDQLPLASQCRCARVCRHWYDCLPAPRLRLMRWLHKNAPQSCLADPGLGRGFSDRAGPFLQAVKSPALPALVHLQQEQQEQQEHRPSDARQDRDQMSRSPAARDLLPCLVHHSLNKQLTHPSGLILHPTPLEWPEDTRARTGHFTFSPCSRWLAVACQSQPESPPHLRLYGWENGAWQRCLLVSEVTTSVDLVKFTSMPPDTLLSIHGVHVLAWNKEPESQTWHSSQVCQLPASCPALNLHPMDDGDLIILTKPQKRAGFLSFLFYRHTEDGRNWEAIMTKTFKTEEHSRKIHCWAAEPRSCQLAVATSTLPRESGPVINTVHIWRKGLNPARPQQWESQHSLLPRHNRSLEEITYSPDGLYLVAVLSDLRVCLWQLDAQCRLQEQLTLPDCLYDRDCLLGRQITFRHDGKQLAVSLSLRQVQLLDCDANGHWQYGPLLETPPAPDTPASDRLKTMQLSSNGRTLARQSHWRVDIWHQDPVEGWQHRVLHRKQEGRRYFPQFCLLEPGELICTSVQDPELSLHIYGPDHQGRLVRKFCTRINAPLCGPDAASPDGLSLLLGATRTAPVLLQLAPARSHGGCRLL